MEKPKLEKGIEWAEPKPEPKKSEESKPAGDVAGRWLVTLGIGAVIGFIAVATSIVQDVFEYVDYDEVTVIQPSESNNAFIDYELKRGSGWHFQDFKYVETYKTRSSIDFHEMVVFKDGKPGEISGSLYYNLPVLEDDILMLHHRFGSQESLERDFIEPLLKKVVHAYAARKTHDVAGARYANDGASVAARAIKQDLMSRLYDFRLKVSGVGVRVYAP